ncbi:MAG: UpxY family transcription antiterminator [Bacteroidales bacterium]|nr:UpxY family transcription antiterminator [Bacteroidales bacterium]
MGRPKTVFWYALRTFKGKRKQVESDFKDLGRETFFPVKVEESFEGGHIHYVENPVMSTLLFVRCTKTELTQYRKDHYDIMMFYREPGTRNPGRIDDKEMAAFRLLCTTDDPHVGFGGEDKPAYHVGDRVRVTDGQFKGYEGHVQRVGKEKCLCVSLTGFFVMFISHIHPKFLEKID